MVCGVVTLINMEKENNYISETELENFKKEYRINKWKKVLEFFKQRGLNIDSPNFISEHGVGISLNLRRIIEELSEQSAEKIRMKIETGKYIESPDSLEEVLSRFFDLYGIDYQEFFDKIRERTDINFVQKSKEIEEMYDHLIKELLSRELI